MNPTDLGIGDNDVVARRKNNLHFSNPGRNRDQCKGFGARIKVDRVVSFAGKGDDAAAHVTGQGLHLFECDCMDASIDREPCQV